MDKEKFLNGLKNRSLCNVYAIKFKNTYAKYIEKEQTKREHFINEKRLNDEKFQEIYGQDWNACWFDLESDNIVDFFNEMGWDFTELPKSKKILYADEEDVSFKNYTIQDIWKRLLEEKDCEYLCWGIYNFIYVLKETKEQNELKRDLQKFMNELYQCITAETEMNEGILSRYIKENKGIDCAFGHIEIDVKNDCLGRGGNGVVYAGQLTETKVAVKFLVNCTSKKLNRFKAEYININMAREKLYNIVNYLHYETIKFENIEVPCIIMKKYDVSICTG